jgi:hypothetical protein
VGWRRVVDNQGRLRIRVAQPGPRRDWYQTRIEPHHPRSACVLTSPGPRSLSGTVVGGKTLEAEYGGVLAFLETCKKLGAPRYTMRTSLDPDALPHVIAAVERCIGASSLRFLLDEKALERADA